MSTEVKKEIQLEIAHVLFIDIVGYSKLSINDQRAAIDELTQAVRTARTETVAGVVDAGPRSATTATMCDSQE